MRMKFFYEIMLVTLVLLMSACVKDLDFNQVEDLELEPSIAVSLVNFELDQNDLSALGIVFIPTIMDETLLPDFNNSLIQEDLNSITMQFEASNTFNDDFTVNVAFLDVNDNITYSLMPMVITGNDEAFKYEEEIEIATNPNFLNSYKISIRLSYSGTVINTTVPNSLLFKSAGIFNFSID